MALHELTTIPTRAGELHVYQGYEDWAVDQLVEKSKSRRLHNSVRRDGEERFISRESFAKWVNKGDGGRVPYMAFDFNQLRVDGWPELAGLTWLGRQRFPIDIYPEKRGVRALHTYAIRAYGLQGGIKREETDPSLESFYEGTGMSKRLSQVATAHYAGMYLLPEALSLAAQDLEPGIWLETGCDNPARTGLYPHMFGRGQGYEEVGTHYNTEHAEWRVGMVLPLGTLSAAGFVGRSLDK